MTQDFLELAYFFSLESVAISCDRYIGVELSPFLKHALANCFFSPAPASRENAKSGNSSVYPSNLPNFKHRSYHQSTIEFHRVDVHFFYESTRLSYFFFSNCPIRFKQIQLA